jgi:hypothetical protein
MLYGKERKAKQFRPFNMRENKFEINLFNASIFYERDLEKLETEKNYMNDHNPEYIFEIREKSYKE